MWQLVGYHPDDFLLFSKAIYHDLVASYGQLLWPLQPIFLFVFLVFIILSCRRHRSRKFETALLCSFTLSLLLIGKIYFLDYFSTINWASRYLAIGFFVQCGFLVIELLTPPRKRQDPLPMRYALLCLVFVICAVPIIDWLMHRRLALTPIIGLDPGITMMALITYIVFFRLSPHLLIIPIAWLLLSMTMHHTMGAQEYILELSFLTCFVLFIGWSRLSRLSIK